MRRSSSYPCSLRRSFPVAESTSHRRKLAQFATSKLILGAVNGVLAAEPWQRRIITPYFVGEFNEGDDAADASTRVINTSSSLGGSTHSSTRSKDYLTLDMATGLATHSSWTVGTCRRTRSSCLRSERGFLYDGTLCEQMLPKVRAACALRHVRSCARRACTPFYGAPRCGLGAQCPHIFDESSNVTNGCCLGS
jgi:hypothetical protein